MDRSMASMAAVVASSVVVRAWAVSTKVCAASPYTGDDLTDLSGMQYAFAALDRDGACALEWSAPALNGGRGLGGRIEVTVVNAHLLMDAE